MRGWPLSLASRLGGSVLGLYDCDRCLRLDDDGKCKGNCKVPCRRWTRRRCTGWAVVMLASLVVALYCLQLTVTLPPETPGPPRRSLHPVRLIVNTCDRAQDLVIMKRNFLPKDKFLQMQEALTNHPAMEKYSYRPLGEVGTKGLHLTFNTHGIMTLAKDPELTYLFDFFKRVRWLDANAWKLNLFLMDTSPGFKADDGVFGIHHDTLQTNNGMGTRLPGEELEIFSHVTDVLYVSFPSDMKGGNLWLWPPKTSVGQDYADEPPEKVIKPEVNCWLQFRGDAFHGVSGFTSANVHASRISLVLEQFRVPAEMYNVTWKWRKSTYQSRFNISTIAQNGAYHVLTDAQRAYKLQGIMRSSRHARTLS